jgi:phage terminase small subunit
MLRREPTKVDLTLEEVKEFREVVHNLLNDVIENRENYEIEKVKEVLTLLNDGNEGLSEVEKRMGYIGKYL